MKESLDKSLFVKATDEEKASAEQLAIQQQAEEKAREEIGAKPVGPAGLYRLRFADRRG